MKVCTFSNKLRQDDTTAIKLLLSDLSYRNEYSYSVLPIKACLINGIGERKDIGFPDDARRKVPQIDCSPWRKVLEY